MSNSERGTVLVVDDDRNVSDLICMTLEQEGYGTVAVGNGREALDYLNSAPLHPGLILLDLMMPVMNGWEFRAAQAKERDLASIPVAIITVLAGAEISRENLGAVDVLAKPSTIESLLTAVARHIH